MEQYNSPAPSQPADSIAPGVGVPMVRVSAVRGGAVRLETVISMTKMHSTTSSGSHYHNIQI